MTRARVPAPARWLLPLLLCLPTGAREPLPTRPGLAVLQPELASDETQAGNLARRLLQVGLADLLHREGRYQLVERKDPKVLDTLMAELNFQNGGLVALGEAKRLGEFAGIDVLVFSEGRLTAGLLGSTLTLRVRFIDVESARLLFSCQVTSRSRPALDPERSAAQAVARALADLERNLRKARPWLPAGSPP